MRLRTGLLTLLVLAPALAGAAAGQVSAPDTQSDGAGARAQGLFPRSSRGATGTDPDTTAPWSYFPIGLGDAWEYRDVFNGEIFRRDVIGDTTIQDRPYRLLREVVRDSAGALIFSLTAPIRYDTATARVLWFAGWEYESAWTPCPLNAPFWATVDCRVDAQYATVGGYDGLWVFEGPAGPDTLRGLSRKEYTHTSAFEVIEYAGGLGIIRYQGKVNTLALYYARTMGVEHGLPQYPVDIEDAPQYCETLLVTVWPNPTDEIARLTLDVPTPDRVLIEVLDVLGRTVRTVDLGARPAGPLEGMVDLVALAPGTYFLRVTVADRVASRPITIVQ